MTVRNMTSARSGREVANQFVIEDGATIVFQSYRTPIASYNRLTQVCRVNYDYFDYSVTTSKYFHQFLNEYVDFSVDIKALKKSLNNLEDYRSECNILYVPQKSAVFHTDMKNLNT